MADLFLTVSLPTKFSEIKSLFISKMVEFFNFEILNHGYSYPHKIKFGVYFNNIIIYIHI